MVPTESPAMERHAAESSAWEARSSSSLALSSYCSESHCCLTIETSELEIVEKTIPNSLRTGDPERYRKVLGFSYLVGGVIFAVVGIVVLAK